jgi:Flp pilus assembly protein TadD
LAEALADAKKANELHPNDAQITALLGQIYTMQKKFVEGETQYSKAIKLAPKAAALYVNRAITLLKQKKLANAQKDATLAIKLEPTLQPAWEVMGEISFADGKYSDSVKYCNQAIKLDANDADAYHYRGLAYEQLGNKTQAALDKTNALKKGYTGQLTIKPGHK